MRLPIAVRKGQRNSMQVEEMVRKSLLSAGAQEEYLRIFHDRLAMFR